MKRKKQLSWVTIVLLLTLLLASCEQSTTTRPKPEPPHPITKVYGKTLNHAILQDDGRVITLVFEGGTTITVESYKYRLKVY